jgi:hypothetical protein
MDRLLSSTQVAAELGWSLPRFHRAIRAGAVAPTARVGRKMRFDPRAVQDLAERSGAVPTRPEGWSREETLVAAALARRPLGARSARVLAAEAGVSPTSASKALGDLQARGVVAVSEEMVAEGRARSVRSWSCVFASPAYQSAAGALRRVILPRPGGRLTPTQTVPSRFAHLFWNQDVARLHTATAGVMIAKRILTSNDPTALRWLSTSVSPHDVAKAASGRGVSPRQAAAGRALAEAAYLAKGTKGAPR